MCTACEHQDSHSTDMSSKREQAVLNNAFIAESKKADDQVLTCLGVLTNCEMPEFRYLQCFCGLLTCVGCGTGLECCCFYGCDRPDYF